ncbi:mannose-P-dolichol utilization defect 1 protein-like isoform X2 [Strigops habroptila]|uniref:mannose-P-dolichol utilization defect 1 protein-like isoform X2 n=1 Tax=Strigops habroptila TaxID=2489341 RepID=UPI0011CF6D87|nr:mannose-P-dolichol utilization defect 1 protein-like isoform X2 [Strigops habroptila]XP_030360021.1 mannose-P-dolichol utilization defect 1 protein-like isoform X2 [Strigops habroptila]
MFRLPTDTNSINGITSSSSANLVLTVLSSGLFIAMIVSLLFPVLLRFTAGVLFWIFIFGVIGIMGYGIWHCYWEYNHIKGIPGSDFTVYDTGFQRDFRVCLQLRQTCAWNEALFLLLQAMTLGFLMQHLGDTRGEGRCWRLVTGYYWEPSSPPLPRPGLITFLQVANLPIVILSRLLQAATNYHQGHTGQLSGVTTTLLFGGAGCGSSLQDTGHPLLALTFTTSAACNGLPLGQLLYYGGGGC